MCKQNPLQTSLSFILGPFLPLFPWDSKHFFLYLFTQILLVTHSSNLHFLSPEIALVAISVDTIKEHFSFSMGGQQPRLPV